MDNNLMELFKQSGALRWGHFMRSSGKHTDCYVQCARLFEQPGEGERIAALLAERFRDLGAELVLGAAVGGILPGYEVSRALNLPFMYCERKDGVMILRRGFSLLQGTRVLIIEDEVTTGTSVREMIEIVRAQGGKTVGVGCFVDKTQGKMRIDLPFEALLSVDATTYRDGSCPLCQEGVPLNRV